MTISLQDISKRYGLEWILKKVNLELITNNQYAVIHSFSLNMDLSRKERADANRIRPRSYRRHKNR